MIAVVSTAAIPDLEAMFAVPAPLPIETRCQTYPLSSQGRMRRIVYDFAEMPLGAIERGPRTNVRERRADLMTSSELHRPFARRANHITRCWKWFAATHPGGDTQLDVHLAIDVFGATGDISVVNAPEDADLATCIRDAFAAPLYAYGPRQREQHTQVTIHFERADQPAWTKAPVRPMPITQEPLPARGSTCVRVVAKPIASRLYPLRVSDFDPSRIPPPPPPAPGMRSHSIQVPSIRVGCVVMTRMPKKNELRAAIQSNWGAYEECHADARARMPDLAGAVEAKLFFDTNGAEPTLASVRGAGDAAFHACLDRALEEIWLDPPTDDTLIEANFTFPLVTDRPVVARDLAAWRAVFANAITPLAGCTARYELVQDRFIAAPWVDDARVRAAVRELTRYIASLSATDAAACLVEVEPRLHEYTGVDAGSRASDAERVEAYLDRLEAVLPVANLVAWGPNLRLMIALAYRKDPARVAEGTAMLQELVSNPNINDVVDVEQAPRSLDDTCAR